MGISVYILELQVQMEIMEIKTKQIYIVEARQSQQEETAETAAEKVITLI